ncbi:MAG: HPr kinase/phosphorylase [Deltaproteobacteria bacterium]|nr:HPr kinase/phosphorylase [Deltaproteobacteria bacterium]
MPPSVTVFQLMQDQSFDLRLQLMAGKGGLSRKISSDRIQKPGLALTGFTDHIHPERVQVFGNTEMSYLTTLPNERQREMIAQLFKAPLACLVVTKDLEVPPVLVETAERAEVPLLHTPHLSSTFITQAQAFLEDALTVSTSSHGVLIDVFGVGILILGKSGIGKSECALDLVMKGHRLVADDIVDIKRRKGAAYGAGSSIIKHHMEVRGLGIINIKDLFGIASVRDSKKIELVIELVEWNPHEEYDRLGLDEQKFNIVDVGVPKLVIPVRPGRNMTTIIEVAARNHLLKLQGHHSALDFQDKLNRAIAEGTGVKALGEEPE